MVNIYQIDAAYLTKRQVELDTLAEAVASQHHLWGDELLPREAYSALGSLAPAVIKVLEEKGKGHSR